MKKENAELLRTIEANETQVVIYFQKQLNVFIFEKKTETFSKTSRKASVTDDNVFKVIGSL